MQKGSVQLLLLISAVLIISAAGLFFYSKQNSSQKIPELRSQDPATVSQSKYSDNTSGFEFTYPKESEIKPDSEQEYNKRGNGDYRKNFKGYVGYEPAPFLAGAVVLDKDENYETNPFSVWVFDNSSSLTLDKWFENYWYYPYLWGVFDWTSKNHIALDSEATVSGQPAKSKIISYQPGKPKFMYISKSGKMYLFRIIGESGEKILSGFKFLD